MTCAFFGSPSASLSAVLLAAAVFVSVAGSIPLWAQAAALDAVVTIYATGADGSTGQGSGFFTSRNGQIFTAYHVVQNAEEIEVVHDQLGSFKAIRVDRISPERDLAVLQVLDSFAVTPYLRLDETYVPNPADNLTVAGYPRQGMRQQFRTQPTHSGYANSLTIFDRRKRPYFALGIDVIQLDATIYNGISGGPLIGPRGVVGVLSGSYDEGGGLAWAIPLRHATSLRPVNRVPGEMAPWPPLTLMAAAWDSLRAIIQRDTAASARYERLIDATETLARHYSDANRLAIETRTKVEVVRPFLQRLVSQGRAAVASDATAPLKDAVTAFKRFNGASTAIADSWRETAAALSEMMAWVTGDAKLEDRTGRALVEEMRRIRDDYRDQKMGLEAYLGLDTTKIAAAMPEFQAAMKNASVAGEAQAWLRLFEAFTPAFDAYGSGKALVFMSRDVEKYRRTARLFEPLVYRTSGRR